MAKTSKIAISLPQDILSAVEKERKSTGESRSEYFRRAVETQMRFAREKELRDQYIRAYQIGPETKEEVEAARRAASNILAETPWHDQR